MPEKRFIIPVGHFNDGIYDFGNICRISQHGQLHSHMEKFLVWGSQNGSTKSDPAVPVMVITVLLNSLLFYFLNFLQYLELLVAEQSWISLVLGT